MKSVKFLVYRYLTRADYFNMHKPLGTEAAGGGQKYIDFRTSVISIARWRSFFAGVIGLVESAQTRNRPKWNFTIHSIGVDLPGQGQDFYIYQRREASVCIPRQHLNTSGAIRIRSWLPENGFPEPDDPADRFQLPAGLAVYFVRTFDAEVWAGWFLNDMNISPPWRDESARLRLSQMVATGRMAGDVGILSFDDGRLYIDEGNNRSPFVSVQRMPARRSAMRPAEGETAQRGSRGIPRPGLPGRRERTEEEIINSLFGEDEDFESEVSEEIKQSIVRVRRRNQRAINDLKELYLYRCQISGLQYSFNKRDGRPYVEAHHLIPLGGGGADNPYNIIIVNPLIHRMLHYANVGDVDLSQILEEEDGSASLSILINGTPYAVRWKPEHARRVIGSQA